MRACEKTSLSALGVLELCWGQDWPTPVGLDGRRQEKDLAEKLGVSSAIASTGAYSWQGYSQY